MKYDYQDEKHYYTFLNVGHSVYQIKAIDRSAKVVHSGSMTTIWADYMTGCDEHGNFKDKDSACAALREYAKRHKLKRSK